MMTPYSTYSPRALGVLATAVACFLMSRTVVAAETQSVRCPYTFGDVMPAGTFCVYHGEGRNVHGDVCAPDLVAIWSSYNGSSGAPSDTLYVALLSDPDVVIAATPTGQRAGIETAEVTASSEADGDAPLIPVRGRMMLRGPQRGADQTGDHLLIELFESEARQPSARPCAVASFSGTFMGVMARAHAVARRQ